MNRIGIFLTHFAAATDGENDRDVQNRVSVRSDHSSQYRNILDPGVTSLMTSNKSLPQTFAISSRIARRLAGIVLWMNMSSYGTTSTVVSVIRLSNKHRGVADEDDSEKHLSELEAASARGRLKPVSK